MQGRVQGLEVAGYRSIEGLEINLSDVNVITGLNGCGKSNLFNAFKLIKSSAEGQLATSLAEQGGLGSALWAGRRVKGPVRIRLAVRVEPFSYELEVGTPPLNHRDLQFGGGLLFPLDPDIKRELICLEKYVIVDRKRSVAHMRDSKGKNELRNDLYDNETIFSQINDPRGTQVCTG